MDEDELRNISEAEWRLLHSLRLRVTYNGYHDKILHYCRENQVPFKRIDELLVTVEPSTIEGVFIGGVRTFPLRGIDFKLAFEVIDKLSNDGNSIIQNDSAKSFRSLFKSDDTYSSVIAELSREDPEKWFDKDGNFVRRGRGKGQDNPSAVCTLLLVLIHLKFFDDKTIKKVKSDLSGYSNSCFGVTVGRKSSVLKGDNNKFAALHKRLVSIKSC